MIQYLLYLDEAMRVLHCSHGDRFFFWLLLHDLSRESLQDRNSHMTDWSYSKHGFYTTQCLWDWRSLVRGIEGAAMPLMTDDMHVQYDTRTHLLIYCSIDRAIDLLTGHWSAWPWPTMPHTWCERRWGLILYYRLQCAMPRSTRVVIFYFGRDSYILQ
jgi:hypothetical protein